MGMINFIRNIFENRVEPTNETVGAQSINLNLPKLPPEDISIPLPIESSVINTLVRYAQLIGVNNESGLFPKVNPIHIFSDWMGQFFTLMLENNGCAVVDVGDGLYLTSPVDTRNRRNAQVDLAGNTFFVPVEQIANISNRAENTSIKLLRESEGRYHRNVIRQGTLSGVLTAKDVTLADLTNEKKNEVLIQLLELNKDTALGIIPDAYTFSQINIPPISREQYRVILEGFCNYYGVPESLILDEVSSNNSNNYQEIRLNLISGAMKPLTNKLQQALQSLNRNVEFNFDEIAMPTYSERANIVATLSRAGVATTNELREILNGTTPKMQDMPEGGENIPDTVGAPQRNTEGENDNE